MSKPMIAVLIRLMGACLIGLGIGFLVRWFQPTSQVTNGMVEAEAIQNRMPRSAPLMDDFNLFFVKSGEVIDQVSLLSFIRSASPSDLEKLLERLDSESDPVQSTLRLIALKRWVERDTSGAVRYSNAKAGQWPMLCLQQMAEADLEKAIKAVRGGQLQYERQGLLTVVLLSKVAETEPRRAFDLANQWSLAGEDASHAYHVIFEPLSAEDPSVAAALVDAVPASAKDAVMHTVAAAWARDDGERAFEWMSSQTNAAMAMVSLGYVWASQDPQGALAHLDELAKYPGSREGILGIALSSWWQDDSEAARAWLAEAELSEEETQSVQWNLVSNLMKTDPKAAARLNAEAVSAGYKSQGKELYRTWAEEAPQSLLDWAKAQTQVEVRNDAALAAIQELSEQEPVAMLDNLPELARAIKASDGWEDTAKALVPVLAAEGREASERWIDALPSNARVAFLTAYGNLWVNDDPKETLDYLTSHSMTDGLVDAAQRLLASTLARRDPATAASVVAEFDDVQMREIGAKNVLVNWMATAPAEAEKWAQTLSDEPMRDGAYSILAEHHASGDLDKAFGYASQITDVYERCSVSRVLLSKVTDEEQAVAYLEQADLLEADHRDLLQRILTK